MELHGAWPPFATLPLRGEKTAMQARLEARTRCSVADFSAALSLRAAKYGQAPMSPEGEVAHIVPGAYYLTGINDKHHRDYARKA